MMAPNNIASTTEAVLGSTRISITPDKSSTSSSKHDKNSKNLRPTSSNGDVILLESPDLVLDSNSRFNCSTIKTYLECSGPWRFLFSNRRQVKWFSYYIHYSFSYNFKYVSWYGVLLKTRDFFLKPISFELQRNDIW